MDTIIFRGPITSSGTKRLFLATLLYVTFFGISANAKSEKKITPVLEIGAGLSVEADSGYGECVKGLATELSLGLDIRLDEKWSMMPQIGHNIMFGDAWYLFRGYVGADFDVYSFYNAAVLGRYKFDDGVAVGFGPAVYITEGETTYYIDADPSDPRQGLVKIKLWDFGLRVALTKDYGKHWRIGALANAGLRNMLYQYPDVGITGHTHLFSLCVTAGFRF